MGYSPYIRQHIAAVAQDCRDGLFSGTNDLVEKLTGQKPLGMMDYATKNKALFLKVGHVASRHPQSMKIRSRSVYDPARPAQDEGRFTLEHRARIKVWLGHRSEPQIVASLRREHAEQIVLPFDVLRRREKGDE